MAVGALRHLETEAEAPRPPSEEGFEERVFPDRAKQIPWNACRHRFDRPRKSSVEPTYRGSGQSVCASSRPSTRPLAPPVLLRSNRPGCCCPIAGPRAAAPAAMAKID